MSAVLASERPLRRVVSSVSRSTHQLDGYVVHLARQLAKQLAKSGRLADMLHNGELLRDVDPAAREYLVNIARAVRYALSQPEVIAAGHASTARANGSWR